VIALSWSDNKIMRNSQTTKLLMSDFTASFFFPFSAEGFDKTSQGGSDAADGGKVCASLSGKSFPFSRKTFLRLGFYCPKAHVRRATIEFLAHCVLAARHSSLFQRKTTRKCNAKHRRKFSCSTRDLAPTRM
jgi:hypothetical protein